MARSIPESRFTDLVRAATAVFIELGYRRTQMADVASELGVAKGTLYVYVESKAALFELCARHCDDVEPVRKPVRLPHPTPARGALTRLLLERLEREGRIVALRAALERKRSSDLRAELGAILAEIFQAMHRNRFALRLMDRCGGDHPEISSAQQRQVREGLQGELTRYLEMRGRSRALRPMADPFLTARLVIETLTTWAVHIHWDPVPQSFPAGLAREAVIELLLGGLLRDRPSR